MAKKKNEKVKKVTVVEKEIVVFRAELAMTKIHNSGVRFRVSNPSGWATDINHIIVGREAFPIDEDFSLSFLNEEIKTPEKIMDPKDPENTAPVTQAEYDAHVAEMKGVEKALEKQERFIKEYEIVIREI